VYADGIFSKMEPELVSPVKYATVEDGGSRYP
jgi:hypothetical protein